MTFIVLITFLHNYKRYRRKEYNYIIIVSQVTDGKWALPFEMDLLG